MSKQAISAPKDSTTASVRQSWTNRLGLATLVTAIIAMSLVATAIVFAVASGTRDAAAQGETGILSEASLSAAAAARNAAVQARVLAEANVLGVATDEETERAIRQADATVTEMELRIERLAAAVGDPATAATIRAQSEKLAADLGASTASLLAGDVEGASTIIDGELDASYRSLSVQLALERDEAMARIALAGDDAGRLADAARFLVVLLVPLAVLVAYRKRVRREQAQRELQHQLEKQQAVSQTKDEFIANLSHELRTPLTAIYGFSLELIEPNRPKNPVFEHELATYIASESADLSRMVEDILAAASADQQGLSVSMSTVDPVGEINSVLGALHATGAQVASELAPGRIATDPLRFRQIIRNLVSNALRHGGPNNLVRGWAEGGVYTVEVRDDGPGIPAYLEDRLFTRFIHQGDEPLLTGSVGLGLAIARLLTTRTGGTIAYRRDNDETVFSVTFPLADSASRHSEGYRNLGPRMKRSSNHDSHQATRTARQPDLKNFGAPHTTPDNDHR